MNTRKTAYFNMRMDHKTRRLLSALSSEMRRTQSDVVRVLIEDAHKQISKKPAQTDTQQPAQAA